MRPTHPAGVAHRISGAAPAPSLEGYRVLVADGPAAALGARLARSAGIPLRLAADGLLAALHREPDLRHGRLLVVALPEELPDEVLAAALERERAALLADVAWDALPGISLVTGRDLATLSGRIDRILAAREGDGAKAVAGRVLHLVGGEETTSSGEIAPNLGWRRRELTDPEEIARTVSAPAAAVAFCAHGTDSCARAGAGVVLCGLRPEVTPPSSWRPGLLACGQGHPCQRGSRPVPLSDLRARVVMLASCNGLRLGSSLLDGDFNLALNALDGSVEAYVSSTTAAAGGPVASRLFLSAVASGRPVGEATRLVNALLLLSGIELPAYLAVGDPELAITGRAARSPVELGEREARAGVELRLGELRLAELVVVGAAAARRGREGRLAISLRPSKGEETVCWLARPERCSEAEEDRLRVFVFRFPEPLGRIRIRLVEAGTVRRRGRRALAGLARWTELLRLSGVAERAGEEASSLRATEELATASWAARQGDLAHDGAAVRALERQVEVVRASSRLARDLVMADLCERLSGPFWLSHLFAAEYHPVGGTEHPCPCCGGSGERREHRHPVHREVRWIHRCRRCGIVADTRAGGGLGVPTIDAAEHAAAGSSLAASLSVPVRDRGELDGLVGALRVSGLAPGRRALPVPRIERRALREGRAVFEFRVPLPLDLPPHQFVIKGLVASTDELSFAARVLFVRPPGAVSTS